MKIGASPFRLLTVGDVRTALLAGHGFPGDKEAFEVDLERARESTSGTDLTAVTAVIVDFRGRVRLRQDPGFDQAVREGIDLTVKLKREAREEAPRESPTRRSSCK
ncbi:hypothetical protein ACFUTR_18020 [Streptomyces sp. NPDC057367]|uniref:hypothetical protein n=1 Tax=Streptomyces sp. NPDC057367 TaxID=3346108 RepID=UPI00362C5CD9